MARARSYPRTWRVNELLHRVIANEIESLADTDERLRLATVMSVDVSPDLRGAIVYIGALPDETEAALEEHRPRLQQVLAHQVRMKRTPRLRFMADPAVETGERVEEILRRLRQERP